MRQVLRHSVRKILTPLIRILIRNGISYGEFDQIARKTFVDVASADFAPAKKKQTHSNVAILTGLNRKEVKKLSESGDDHAEDKSQQYNRVVRVLGGWINDKRFLRDDGNPRDLPTEGEDSFTTLVKDYSGDMPAAAMHKVLVASGNIKVSPDGKIRLLSHAYLPSNDEAEKLVILGNDAGELIETIDFNLSASREDLRFQRKASNPQVAISSIPKIKQFLRRKGQAFLEEVDLYLTQHETDKDDNRVELSVGVFYHESENAEQDDEKE